MIRGLTCHTKTGTLQEFFGPSIRQLIYPKGCFETHRMISQFYSYIATFHV